MALNPLLVTSFSLAGLVELLAPVLLGVFLSRRFAGRWRYWWYGVLVFLLSQGITRVPAMVYFQTRPAVKAALAEPVWFWSFLVFAAVTAGLFEEGGRWLAFRFAVPPAERRWRTALMLGAGHGGLESIGVGMLTVGALVEYLTITPRDEPMGAAVAQVEEARKQFAMLSDWEPLLGAWERLGAITIQVALTVLVLQTFVRGRCWWWYALGAHALVDFTSVAVLRLASKAWGRQAGMLAVEGLVTVYALFAFWLIVSLRRNEREETMTDASCVVGEGAAC